jgi:hypothetical protein
MAIQGEWLKKPHFSCPPPGQPKISHFQEKNVPQWWNFWTKDEDAGSDIKSG